MSDTLRRWIIFGLVVVAAVIFIAPSVAKYGFGKQDGLGAWLSKPITLGLDLSGGVHLVYQVETEEAVKSHLQSVSTAVRGELRANKVAVVRSRAVDDLSIEVLLLRPDAVEKAQGIITDKFRDIAFQSAGERDGRGVLTYSITPAQAERIQKESVDLAIEKLRMRVDQFGVAEPLIQRSGERRIILQMPGVSDVEAVKRVVGSVAKLEFRLVPVGPAGGVTVKTREGGTQRVEDDVLLTGDAVKTARVNISGGEASVDLSLTSEGGTSFYRITQEHTHRQLAIILDGVLYSAPEIKEPIPGGQAQISGRFTVEEARNLAVVLRSGSLPAPMTVLEERTVGPSLGRESIEKGLAATLIGFAFIIVFMVVYYQKSGVVAVASLLLNALLVFAGLSAFGATLTLPGIAGIALTIGMAVDSNVIIFERIRDELRIGASRDAAVAAGFDKALSAIMDANITTLLSAAVLYFAGTGPVRGFAVTLSIGVLTTVFCAIFVTKLLFEQFELRGREGLSI